MRQLTENKFLIFLLAISFIMLLSEFSFAVDETVFVNNLNESYGIQPYYVEKQSTTRFIVRPTAIPISGSDSYVDLYFGASTADPADTGIQVDIRSESGDDVSGFPAQDANGGSVGDPIYWELTSDNKVRIRINRSAINNNLQPPFGETYQVTFGSEVLCKITIKDVVPAPIIHADIIGYEKEYNDPLSSEKIYYVPDNAGAFRVNNALTMDRVRYRAAPNIAESYSTAISITGFFNDYPSAINDTWDNKDHNDVGTSNIWDNFQIGPDVPTDIADKLNYLASNNILNAKIFRVVGENYGAADIAARNYYIVRDQNAPSVEPVEPLLETPGDSFAQVRRPELSIKIKDTIGGIGSKDDIDVKYRRLGESESLPATKAEFNTTESTIRGMQVLDLEPASETRTGADAGIQNAEMVPYNQMGEGEYAVWISVDDKAGNNSKDHTNGPFIFYLEINQTNPRINNVSMNNRIIDLTSTESTPIGADDLDLYFEAYGGNDLIYGIRYIKDGEESDWFLKKLNDVSYISQYISRSLLNWSATGATFTNAEGKAKDGPYEVFIWLDEEEIYKDSDGNSIDDFHDLVGENGSGFFAPGGPNGIVDNYILDETDTDRRQVERFTIIVDNSPPQYVDSGAGSLKYYESYPSSLIDLDPGNPINIYQGTPVFQMKFSNASEIKQDNIQVAFVNQDTDRRVTGEVINLNWDQENDIHTFEFAPVIKLTPGTYTLQVSPTDVFGNVADKEFQDLFEIVTTASGDVTFSINDGERLNINQSSALEININSQNLKPKEKGLRIMINGSPVVIQGKIVDDIVSTEGGGQDIKYRSEDYFATEEYYTDDNYQANGYDVMFPGNDKRTIIIFSRLPLPTGRNRVTVEVVDENGVLTNHWVEFMVDNYRQGFGFGRLLPASSK